MSRKLLSPGGYVGKWLQAVKSYSSYYRRSEKLLEKLQVLSSAAATATAATTLAATACYFCYFLNQHRIVE